MDHDAYGMHRIQINPIEEYTNKSLTCTMVDQSGPYYQSEIIELNEEMFTQSLNNAIDHCLGIFRKSRTFKISRLQE